MKVLNTKAVLTLGTNRSFFINSQVISILIETENSFIIISKYFLEKEETRITFYRGPKEDLPPFWKNLRYVEEQIDIKDYSYEEIEKLIIADKVRQRLKCKF